MSVAYFIADANSDLRRVCRLSRRRALTACILTTLNYTRIHIH